MQRIDARAIHTFGIPRLLLMEHAGLAVARHAQVLYRARLGAARIDRPLVICCGAGYNGGDGLAAARHLLAWGYRVRVLLAAAAHALRDEPAVYAAILRRLGAPPRAVASRVTVGWMRRQLAPAGVIVDALLGIGVRGAVREPVASVITAINAAGKPVVAADVPSGLDADTGRALGPTVRASLTVMFGLAKQGCLAAAARPYVGRLIVEPITFPPQLLQTTK